MEKYFESIDIKYKKISLLTKTAELSKKRKEKGKKTDDF